MTDERNGMDDLAIQWYPGHMAKAVRMMRENRKLVDLIIEMLDARVPASSRNPDIDALTENKYRLILLNKADLADPEITKRWIRYFKERGAEAAAIDARNKKLRTELPMKIKRLCREKTERDREKGIVARPLRAMVAGIPNVGKSTLINTLAGRASAKTGNRPGVTKGKQWITLQKELELLDTPGLLWPKFEDTRTGRHLAVIGSVNGQIVDSEALCLTLLSELAERYPALLQARYGVDAGDGGEGREIRSAYVDDSTEASAEASADIDTCGGIGSRSHAELLLARICESRKLLKKGGAPDTARGAAMLLDEFKSGKIGRISLEDESFF